MSTISLDSHKIFDVLIEKGFTRRQAEGVLFAIQEIDLGAVASKEDVYELKGEVKENVLNLKVELTKFILLNTFASITLIVTLVKLL